MDILDYTPAVKEDFISINKAWILSLFGEIEKEDEEVFAAPERIIEQGGMIMFAVTDDGVAATGMIKPLTPEKWELCKLGANENIPHKGAGTAVFKALMDYAKKQGAKTVLIETNSKLGPALHIYEKYGFTYVPMIDSEYKRVDVIMEYKFE